MRKNLVVICGPTAVGKTKYAIEAAKALEGEVVSCDSMQLYRFMDIGSAKPTPEEQAQVPHHLVDVIDPRDNFSVATYANMAQDSIREILARDKMPIVAGGTGLYLNSILYELDFSAPPPEDPVLRQEFYDLAEQKGPLALHERLRQLDPAAAERIHPNNVKKVVRACESAALGVPVPDFSQPKRREEWNPVLVCLTRNREELYDRINQRVDILMEQGLLSEVEGLLSMGLTDADISMKGIGYKEIIGYLQGEYDLAEAVRLIKRNTRHLAKRQLTWFRRYSDMTWFNISEYEDDAACIKELNQWLKDAIKQ